MLDVNLADQTAAPTPSVPLTDRDREILAFERQWWKYAGSKEQAIKELFDMSSTRYYQVLNGLINNPAALSEDPMLIKRMRRLRDQRQGKRQQRTEQVNRALQNKRVGKGDRRAGEALAAAQRMTELI